ncbi:hypothetical protein L6164_003650 [Bauhinia variegata]|uniref:Uncharacterized protein n=1 Tax=Bauhinia variegata TaxID=167791 RepID=A0ACB9Q1Z5_BAUVA|nr:hypothetical protein L6164_003650 [Bauhinia variegata]
MDATHNMFCGETGLANPLSAMGMQVSFILVISHFFNLMLRTMGQPGPIAQILAGLVLGPTALSRINLVEKAFFLQNSMNYYQVVSFFSRILFMFLFGLETDMNYTKRNLNRVSLIACGGTVIGLLFGLAVSFYLYQQFGYGNSKIFFCMITMLNVAYTGSPIVIVLATELRFAASDAGRIAVSSALITEMGCLIIYNILLNLSVKAYFRGWLLILVTVGLVVINRYLALWLNKRHRNQKYLKAPEVLFILVLLLASSMIIEMEGSNSIIHCFVVGLMFPREGKTARTLSHQLSYSVYNFLLPVYFGYIGFQCNLGVFKSLNGAIGVGILILLSIGSKLCGTILVCRYLNMPTSEGIFLGFILNTRAYADLLFIGSASKSLINLNDDGYNVFVVSIVLNTIITGIIVSFLRKGEHRLFDNRYTALEFEEEQEELRILSCVYDPRQISTILALVLALNGSKSSPSICYLMHLIELVKKIKNNMFFHQKENAELSDEEEYHGGNDIVEINDAVDSFTAETKILIHNKRTVCPFETMYEDVCNDAEDLHAAIVLLPFHKHQRIDGKMESGKEGMRITNQKVLRHGPCSTGILVQRGNARVPEFSELITSEITQNVVTLFFGGPDDREAIAWSIRMAKHPRINLTVMRFLASASASASSQGSPGENAPLLEQKEILMSLSGEETVNEVDNTFMVDFYNRHVASGQIAYVEKNVEGGAETLAALRDIGSLYSLFIVGKGGRGNCSLTIGMSDWEECPELGAVGDVMASSDFDIHGSVLVIQQHKHVRKPVTETIQK